MCLNVGMADAEPIKNKFEALRHVLDERALRLWAATEARALGYGGISLVARASGLSRPTIAQGLRELEGLSQTPPTLKPRQQRVRRPGAGRKRAHQSDPTLQKDLEALVEPLTRGDPMSALRWTCKSTARLAEELASKGHAITDRTVARLLRRLAPEPEFIVVDVCLGAETELVRAILRAGVRPRLV